MPQAFFPASQEVHALHSSHWQSVGHADVLQFNVSEKPEELHSFPAPEASV